LLQNAFFRPRIAKIDSGWGFAQTPPEELTTLPKPLNVFRKEAGKGRGKDGERGKRWEGGTRELVPMAQWG